MSEFEIKKKVTEAVTRRVTQETKPTKEVKPRPTVSEDRIRQIIAEEIANLKIPGPEFSDKARDALLMLLSQCETLAEWKAGHPKGKLRPWQKKFRDNINNAERALGQPVINWSKMPTTQGDKLKPEGESP